MQLTGIHHLTAISADAPGNFRFYTQVLGMRLVKKTVNQDDTSAYHLFYADGEATPGSDITFFEWPVAKASRGTRSIVRTALRVAGVDALHWWIDRFERHQIAHSGVILRNNRAAIDFEDPEGQRLTLLDDEGRGAGVFWPGSPVPQPYQIRGLGPVTLSIPKLEQTNVVLRELLGMRLTGHFRDARIAAGDIHVYSMGEGGVAAELHVAMEPDAPIAREGAGAVHHVALRIPSFEEYDAWAQKLAEFRYPNSGPIDRYYFRSLYFRDPNGILFELATDGPGFDIDEPMDALGMQLSLPPFLEAKRAAIEKALKPL